MSIFLTGGTGYLGSYVTRYLLDETAQKLHLLVRAKDRKAAEEKLWRALQLHMGPEKFYDSLSRIEFVYGDLTAPNLGISKEQHARVRDDVDSVLHIAASLNRKSEKECLNTNLRGTLSVIRLARELADARQLKRYSHVSTVAVAGQRLNEEIEEDSAIEWDRSDYDPYARTKKFAEHMGHELLPDVTKTYFRPSIVMGDSRMPETTQFDMVRAFTILAELPVLPLAPDRRLDIVNADFVGKAIARVHTKSNPKHGIYHLSSGIHSLTTGDVARIMADSLGRRHPTFVPGLSDPFGAAANLAASMKQRNVVQQVGSLMKVFWPYITYNTVFRNERIVDEIGEAPTPFSNYCVDLYKFAKRVNFQYPYAPLPPRATAGTATTHTGREVHA